MEQENASVRFEHGVPAGLSSGKSADLWNPKAVQQRAKQLSQSARKADRVSVRTSEESMDVISERSF
jgi:hypothetical protein